MASIENPKLIIASEYRPCYVDGKKALFHRWTDKREIVPPSIMKGGHGGGVIAGTLAIVEFEDGTIAEVYPRKVKFEDNKLNEYAFF